MKAYKLSIGSPVYQEVYSYAKKKVKKIVKDECRKHLILRFTARHTTVQTAQSELEKIVSYFAKLTGNSSVADLSTISWGEPYKFDTQKGLFQGAICIPKNFDCPEEQREFLKESCKAYEASLNETYASLCGVCSSN